MKFFARIKLATTMRLAKAFRTFFDITGLAGNFSIFQVWSWNVVFFGLALNIALISVFSPHRWRCKDFFIEMSSRSDKLISIAFFPRPGINPTARDAPLFRGTTWDTLLTEIVPWSRKGRRRMKKKKKANRKNHFVMAGVWTHDLCLQSRVFYPLDHGT